MCPNHTYLFQPCHKFWPLYGNVDKYPFGNDTITCSNALDSHVSPIKNRRYKYEAQLIVTFKSP